MTVENLVGNFFFYYSFSSMLISFLLVEGSQTRQPGGKSY